MLKLIRQRMLVVVKVKGPLGDKDEIGIVFVVHCSYIFKIVYVLYCNRLLLYKIYPDKMRFELMVPKYVIFQVWCIKPLCHMSLGAGRFELP